MKKKKKLYYTNMRCYQKNKRLLMLHTNGSLHVHAANETNTLMSKYSDLHHLINTRINIFFDHLVLISIYVKIKQNGNIFLLLVFLFVEQIKSVTLLATR